MLEPGDTVVFWDESFGYRTGRYLGTVERKGRHFGKRRIEWRKLMPDGWKFKVLKVNPDRVRKANDERSRRSQGHDSQTTGTGE